MQWWIVVIVGAMLVGHGLLGLVEDELIRSAWGRRKRARPNGVRFGRKPKLTEHQRTEAPRRRGSGESLAAKSRTYNVSVSMISRL